MNAPGCVTSAKCPAPSRTTSRFFGATTFSKYDFAGAVGVNQSLATIEQHSRPLAEATTPSLEALQAYSAALKEFSGARRQPLLHLCGKQRATGKAHPALDRGAVVVGHP